MTSCCGEGNVEVSGFSYQQLTTAMYTTVFYVPNFALTYIQSFSSLYSFILATPNSMELKISNTVCTNSPMSEAHQTSDKKFSMYLVIL